MGLSNFILAVKRPLHRYVFVCLPSTGFPRKTPFFLEYWMLIFSTIETNENLFFDSSLLHTNIGAMASGEAIRSGQRLVAAAEAKIVIIGQATPLQAAALTVPGSRGHRTANAANRVPRVSEPTRIH